MAGHRARRWIFITWLRRRVRKGVWRGCIRASRKSKRSSMHIDRVTFKGGAAEGGDDT